MAGTMEGLGVPLFGGYTSYLPNGTTSYLRVGAKGTFHLDTTHTVAADEATPIGIYTAAIASLVHAGASAQMTSSQSTGKSVNAGGAFSLIYEGTSDEGTQNYGLFVNLTLDADAENSGGRDATLCLFWDRDSGYTGLNDAAQAFIHFACVDQQLATIFTIAGATKNSSFFIDSDATVTAGLRIIVGTTKYNIMLSAGT